MAERKTWWFGGHRQPEINERLDQINNFLADEDVYRYPDFEKKLHTIAEYLDNISNKCFRYDLVKFRDAKRKYKMHMDIIGTVKDGLLSKPPTYAKYDIYSTIWTLRAMREMECLESNRLIAQEVGSTSKQKEILLRGIRRNHPPFKIDEAFADEFEKAFKSDWYQDPKTVNEETNLVQIEGSAYINTLENAISIPHLLNNLENIFMQDFSEYPGDLELGNSSSTTNETNGLGLSDELLRAGFTANILKRLRKTEKVMNDILKKWPRVDRIQYNVLIEFVTSYAPEKMDTLVAQFLRLKQQGHRLSWQDFGTVEHWVKDNLAKYYELEKSYSSKINEWIDKLKINGLSLVPTIQNRQCVVVLQPRSAPSTETEPVSPEESPIPDTSERVDLRGIAEIRGTRRAAIELALNLFATNKEQHKSGQRFRRVELPRPRSQIPDEVPLSLPVRPEDRPIEQDPFKFTKAMFHLRKSLQEEYSNAREQTEKIGWILPANYDGPLMILTGQDLYVKINKKRGRLLTLQKRLIESQKLRPRPFLDHLNNIVDKTTKLAINLTEDKETLDNDEFRLLESLIEYPDYILWDEFQSTDLRSFLRQKDIEWKLNVPWFKIVVNVIERTNQLSGVPGDHEVITKAIRKYTEKRAVKLGRDIKYLTGKLTKAFQSRHSMSTTQLRSEQLPSQNNTALLGLAEDVLKCSPDLSSEAGITISPGLGTLTASQAAKVIQLQMIREAHNNQDWIFPERDNVWGFATYWNSNKRFFSLDTWPAGEDSDSGFEEMDSNQSESEYTLSNKRKRKRSAGSEVGRENATESLRGQLYYKGPAVLPFGETPYQRAVQSFILSDDLANAPKRQNFQGTNGKAKEDDKNNAGNAE